MRVGLLPVPPGERSWAIGKTAWSINFVLNAQEYIANNPDISPEDLSKLQTEALSLKEGHTSLTADVDIKTWLHPAPETPAP